MKKNHLLMIVSLLDRGDLNDLCLHKSELRNCDEASTGITRAD